MRHADTDGLARNIRWSTGGDAGFLRCEGVGGGCGVGSGDCGLGGSDSRERESEQEMHG